MPEKESTWQLVIGLLAGFAGMVALFIAEAKHRQTLQMLKEIKVIEKTIKEVCHE